MFDKLKKLLGVKTEGSRPEPPSEAPPKTKKKLSPKEEANVKGEPYVAILKVELDPNNIGSGAFELDWNDKFIANLVRAGYQMRPNEPEDIIVDRWFQTICRNVIAENFEQEQADPDVRRNTRRDLGKGRTEIS